MAEDEGVFKINGNPTAGEMLRAAVDYDAVVSVIMRDKRGRIIGAVVAAWGEEAERLAVAMDLDDESEAELADMIVEAPEEVQPLFDMANAESQG